MPLDIVKFGVFIFGETAETAECCINTGFDGDKDIPRKMFLGGFWGEILFLGTFWEIFGKFLGKSLAVFEGADKNKEVLLK